MAVLELTAAVLVVWRGWSSFPLHFLQAWCVIMAGLFTLRIVAIGLTVNGLQDPQVKAWHNWPPYPVIGLNLGWVALIFYFLFLDIQGGLFNDLTPAFLTMALSLVLIDRAFLQISLNFDMLTGFCLFAALPLTAALWLVGGIEARASAIALLAFCWAARRIVVFFKSGAVQHAGVEANYNEARREAGNLAFLVASTEETLKAVMNNIPGGFAICDKNMRFVSWNDAYLQLMDISAEWMTERRSCFDLAALHAERGEPPARMVEWQETFVDVLNKGIAETEIQRPNGAVYHSRLVRLPGEKVLFIYTDITEAKKVSAEAMVHFSQHDPLTGLANRVKFRRALEKALAHAKQHKTQVNVMVLNIDRFKEINDLIGHPTGDELLRVVASRIAAGARKSDLVARLGGDEFAVLGSGHQSTDEAVLMAKRLLKAVATKVELNGKSVKVSTSIGISSFPCDNAHPDELMRRAETALYRAKLEGRGHYRIYDESMHEEIQARVELERDLRTALEKRDLIFHYQPQIDLKTKQVIGLEALVRWAHETRGWVPPSQFIPVAEKADLIIPMTETLLPQACALACKLQTQGFKPLRVAVNLSPIHFLSDGILRCVSKSLLESGLAPELLELEITEGTVMQDSQQVIDTLLKLDELGVKLAIDDFGTGYSSLSYLKKFPVDKLKIDQSFVRDVPHDPGASAIVEAVIKLGHSFGLKVIAEGVETKEQLEYLTALGCDEVQGFYYSQALAEEDLLLWLEDWHIIEPSVERDVG